MSEIAKATSTESQKSESQTLSQTAQPEVDGVKVAEKVIETTSDPTDAAEADTESPPTQNGEGKESDERVLNGKGLEENKAEGGAGDSAKRNAPKEDYISPAKKIKSADSSTVDDHADANGTAAAEDKDKADALEEAPIETA